MPVDAYYQQQPVAVPQEQSFYMDVSPQLIGTPSDAHTGQLDMIFRQPQPCIAPLASSTLPSAAQQNAFTHPLTTTYGRPAAHGLDPTAFQHNQPFLPLTAPTPISSEGAAYGGIQMQQDRTDGVSILSSVKELHLCDGCYYFSMTYMDFRPSITVIRPSSKCIMRTSNCNFPSTTPPVSSQLANARGLPVQQRPSTYLNLTPPDSSSNSSSPSSSQSPGRPTQSPPTASVQAFFYCSSSGCNRHADAPNPWPFPRKDNRNKHELDVHGIPRPQRQQAPRQQAARRQNAMMSGAALHRRLVAVTKQSQSQSPVESML